MVLEQLGIHVQKIKPEPTLRTYKTLTQNGSDLNAKPKAIQFLEENLRDLGLGKGFLGHKEHESSKKKRDKSNIGEMKIKSFRKHR